MHPSLTSSKMFDVIEIGPDGQVLVGTSHFYSRYWTGQVSVFDSVDDASCWAECRSSINFGEGVSCAAFLSGSNVIVASDSGLLSVVTINTKSDSGPTILGKSSEHSNVINALSFSRDKTKAITGSSDRSLKVWDMTSSDLMCTQTFRPAHSDMVNSVSIHPEDDNIVLSCSEDGQVILWDLRLSKPAFAISKTLIASRPSCLAFRRGGPCSAIIGTVSGSIYEMQISEMTSADKLVPTSSLLTAVHKRTVRQIIPAAHRNDLFASIAEESKVAVSSLSRREIIYSDERHTDFVRGVSWNSDGLLLTCGWDQQILTHRINEE